MNNLNKQSNLLEQEDYEVLVDKPFLRTAVTEWMEMTDYDLFVASFQAPMMDMVLNVAVGPVDEFIDFMNNAFEDGLPDGPDLHKSQASLTWIDGDMRDTYFMHLESPANTPDNWSSIVHELHHFVHIYFDRTGIEHSKGSEELYAHAQGYFSELCLRAITELNKETNATD